MFVVWKTQLRRIDKALADESMDPEKQSVMIEELMENLQKLKSENEMLAKSFMRLVVASFMLIMIRNLHGILSGNVANMKNIFIRSNKTSIVK